MLHPNANRKNILPILIAALLMCGVAGISYALEAPTVEPGDSDTELKISFSDFIIISNTYEVEIRRKTPQGDWQRGCTTVHGGGPPAGTGTVTIIISRLESGTTYQVRYRNTNAPICLPFPPGDPGPWSPIGEGTTSGSRESEPTQPEDGEPNGTQSEETSSDEAELSMEVIENYVSPPTGYTVLDGLAVSEDRIVFRIGGLFLSAGIGGCIRGGGTISINGVSYQMHSSKWIRRDNSTSPWVDVPGTAGTQELCGYSPTSAGEYTVVIEMNVDGVREKYASSTLLRVTGDSPSTPTTETTDATVSITPASVASAAIGEQIEFSLNITVGEAVAAYKATVQFDTTALRYVSAENGDFLPTGAFFVEPVVEGNRVSLAAISPTGESNGDGTLATLAFEVIAVKASTLILSDVLLSNSASEGTVPQIENAEITEPTGPKEDVNGDGIVNIQDLVLVASNLGETGQNATDVNGDGQVNIQDLVLVAGALGTGAAAPSLHLQSLDMLTAADVKLWLSQARQARDFIDATSVRGIQFLQNLLAVLTPKETILLPNYPNPFNPETWIPYHLAKDADVSVHIYAVNGILVRTLTLGHQPAGIYQNRSRAAYWDGRNELGEQVASGVYFYTFTAGDFTATRKMLIRK